MVDGQPGPDLRGGSGAGDARRSAGLGFARSLAGWRRPPLAGAGADHGVCHVRHIGPADSYGPLAGRGASGLGDAAELGGQEPLPAVSDYI